MEIINIIKDALLEKKEKTDYDSLKKDELSKGINWKYYNVFYKKEKNKKIKCKKKQECFFLKLILENGKIDEICLFMNFNNNKIKYREIYENCYFLFTDNGPFLYFISKKRVKKIFNKKFKTLAKFENYAKKRKEG